MCVVAEYVDAYQLESKAITDVFQYCHVRCKSLPTHI